MGAVGDHHIITMVSVGRESWLMLSLQCESYAGGQATQGSTISRDINMVPHSRQSDGSITDSLRHEVNAILEQVLLS